MRLLFIGDIIGRPGRDIVAAELPRIRERLALDFVVANAENAAGGFGVTRAIANELFSTGVDVLTTGNHWADQKEILGFIDEEDRIVATGRVRLLCLGSNQQLAGEQVKGALGPGTRG